MSLKAFRVTALFAALAFASTSFAEGDLDTTFAGVGWTTIALGTGALYESRVLPDGKIVVGTTRATRFMPAVARLLADGTPDPTFGNQGPGRSAFDMTAFGFGFGDQHTAGFTVSPDGSKIYLSGRAYGTSSYQGAIVRIDAAGQLDATFGTGGVLQTGTSAPHFLAADPDGRVVRLAEVSFVPPSTLLTLSRMTADGASDPSFAMTVLPSPMDGNGRTEYMRVIRAADGSYYVVGRLSNVNFSEMRVAVVHVLANGTLDAAFAGGTGMALIDFNLGVARRTWDGDLAVLPDGKLMVAAAAETAMPTGRHCGVARLTSDGVLDATFGNGGMRDYDITSPSTPAPRSTMCGSIVVRRDGRIIVAGYSSLGMYAMALNSDGSLYTNYGNNGVAMHGGYSAVLDHADRLVLTSIAGEPTVPYVIRLTSNDAIFEDGFEP